MDYIQNNYLSGVQSNLSETRNYSAAIYRIDQLMGHSYKMLEHIGNQYKNCSETADKVNQICQGAENKLASLQFQLVSKIALKNKQLLEKEDVKDLKNQLKKAEQEIAYIIHDVQSQVAVEISQIHTQGIQDKFVKQIKSNVLALAQGGWKSKWIRFLGIILKTHRLALEVFSKTQQTMQEMSKQSIQVQSENLPKVEQDRLKEFENYQMNIDSLDRRAGVIGVNSIYRIQTFFNKKAIRKQLTSFIAQNNSDLERTTIKRQIVVGKDHFTSNSIPINKEFDAWIQLKIKIDSVFKSIFGNKGIASSNRNESHLVNGWESNLIYQDKTIFQALRHAITSAKNEKDSKIRKKHSEAAAQELLTAALLQEMATQKLTLEYVQKNGITLNLNSVSLVTPDDLRPYIPNQANEFKMLQDQALALQNFADKETTLELDGQKIKVNVHINTFNFGVNALAVKYNQGLANQYTDNKKSLIGLKEQVNAFKQQIQQKRLQMILKIQKTSKEDLDLFTLLGNLKNQLKNVNELMNDIELLMQDKTAYLRGDNQYEIGAKILNLSNLLDQKTMELINNESREKRLPGVKCAFNCMSGKDRTGIMDGIAKTFAIMAAQNNGHYPSHAELQQEEKRKEFAQILTKVLLEGGSLEITEINTGAKGYKVQNEARIYGMNIEDFLNIQGLSHTTSS